MIKKIFDKPQILNSLEDNGYAIIEDYFDIDFCNKAILEIESSVNSYKNETHLTNGSGGDIRFYKFERVSNCAEIFSKDQFLLSIGEKYFGKKLSTHFVLAGKLEFSEATKASSGGGWHRDSDGIQFKAMVYLNDVKSNNGPFLFVPNSKKIDAKRQPIKKLNSLLFYVKRFLKYQKIRDPRYSEKSISNFFRKRKQVPIEIVAPKGSVVLFDSSYIHRGKIIQNGVRYSLTNYYFEDSIKSQETTLKNFGHLFVS
jgi:hypothetical protein